MSAQVLGVRVARAGLSYARTCLLQLSIGIDDGQQRRPARG